MAVRDVTSLDVARLAGVSRTAVSLVLNGHADGNVAIGSQEKILAAAKKLGYKPNSIAVSLRNQRTSTLGIVTDQIVSSPFAGRVISGASGAALERGYVVLVIDTDQLPERDPEAIETLQQRRVDGLIYAAGSLHELDVPDQLLAQPAALANCFDSQQRLMAVVPDEFDGSRSATELLLGLGHRRIVLLQGGKGDATPLREQGYRSAMDRAGLKWRAQKVVPCGWNIDGGYRAAEAVLTGTERPTAILCSNDRSATGVLLFAASAGIRVPEQLSVVGYDDQEFVAANLVPALTTVALPHAEIGAETAKRLIDIIERRSTSTRPEKVLMKCPLVIRKSSGPAPA
ncbi:LacI family DNA-binding transcriptional regulator [Arthrobacter sp. 92]|uniref:LacI family DNA-binding transcriptional regulator n=1 Tax=Arthrobacter sp. 92 TaxID=3418175 RepID=UPI003D0081CD